MYFRILGPLDIDNDGKPVALSGRGPRVVLAALLTGANDVVPIDRLIEWLWPRRPPPSAPATVQGHLSRLRRALEPDRPPWTPSELLIRRHTGYLLRISPDQLDALRFERLVAAGRTALERGEPEPAARLLGEALGLWRGAVLSDIAAQDGAQQMITRLDALRLSAEVLRIDAELRLGRHMAVVPELEWLVRAHPLDERLSAQLMLALYRCGRQAEALNAYERMRLALSTELHIAPAPAAQRIQAAILAQDPDLELPAEWYGG